MSKTFFVQSKIIGTDPSSANGEPEHIGDSVGASVDCTKEHKDDLTQSPRVRKNKDGTCEVIHLDPEGEPVSAHCGSYTHIPAFKLKPENLRESQKKLLAKFSGSRCSSCQAACL